MARSAFVRDSSGRVLHYHSKEAPSNSRLRDILRQAERSGAKSVGLVADVEAMTYEDREHAQRTIRDYRNTPASLIGRLSGKEHPGSLHATSGILSELKASSGAESVSGLKGFNLNFIY